MEERIELIKGIIDRYLGYADREVDIIKKDKWIELAAHWEQYLEKISGVKYRAKDCGLFNALLFE